jgi:hypothetical protein
MIKIKVDDPTGELTRKLTSEELLELMIGVGYIEKISPTRIRLTPEGEGVLDMYEGAENVEVVDSWDIEAYLKELDKAINVEDDD